MSDSPYFPHLYGEVDCGKCEIASECCCRGRYQRNRRDFSHTSGRCPGSRTIGALWIRVSTICMRRPFRLFMQSVEKTRCF